MENASVIFSFFAQRGAGQCAPPPHHLSMVRVRSSAAAAAVAAAAAIAAATVVATTAAPVSAATAAAQDDQDDDDPQAAAAAPTATVKPHNEVPPDLDVGPPLAASLHLMCQLRFGSALQKFPIQFRRETMTPDRTCRTASGSRVPELSRRASRVPPSLYVASRAK